MAASSEKPDIPTMTAHGPCSGYGTLKRFIHGFESGKGLVIIKSADMAIDSDYDSNVRAQEWWNHYGLADGTKSFVL